MEGSERARHGTIWEASIESRRNHWSEGPEEERAWGIQGRKETSVGGVEGARSQKGMGALRTVGELWLDSVEVEDLGKVLNRGMTELDLVC